MKLRELLLEFSYSRSNYKDQLEHILRGAIREFYKAEFALANGERTYVVHWLRESGDLLAQFSALLKHPVKGCRNRRKAIEEVLKSVRADDRHFRRVAKNIICRDFKGDFKIPIPTEATSRFYKLVDAEIEAAEFMH